jgi:hypothetical protein
MTAVHVPMSDLIRWTSVPPLDEYDLEQMSVDEVELLLRIRLRAFVGRGHGWRHALMLALTPDKPCCARRAPRGSIVRPWGHTIFD